MSNIFLSLFSISLTFTVIHCYSPPKRFCDDMESLCLDSGLTHLYCGGILEHNPELGTTPLRIEVDEQLYLDLHNELRNMIACGQPRMYNLAGEAYPRAYRLNKFVWDEELAWAADLNARTCSGYHDCKLTPTHRFVGQNLGLRISFQAHDITELIKHVVKSWFLEYLNTPVSIVDSYSTDIIKSDEQLTVNDMHKMENVLKDKSLIRENRHFAQIVRDRSNRLGCAVYSCGESETGMPFSYYMVCNYESANLEGSTVYTKADISGSGCDARSKEYTCLCLDPAEHARDTNNNLFEKSRLVMMTNGTKVLRFHPDKPKIQKINIDSTNCNRILVPRIIRPPVCKCPTLPPITQIRRSHPSQDSGSKILSSSFFVVFAFGLVF